MRRHHRTGQRDLDAEREPGRRQTGRLRPADGHRRRHPPAGLSHGAFTDRFAGNERSTPGASDRNRGASGSPPARRGKIPAQMAAATERVAGRTAGGGKDVKMPSIRLPINIDEALKGHTVEWERLEFKKGWNPEAVLHTLCAFANDFHNLGGGYIVIGIEEKDGQPILPPAGIPANRIDKIQKDILSLGYKLQPSYHPIIAPYVIQDRHVLILWAPGGQTRPYKAPVSLSKDAKEYAYYIRKTSATVRATHNDEIELLGLTATVPLTIGLPTGLRLTLALIRTFCGRWVANSMTTQRLWILPSSAARCTSSPVPGKCSNLSTWACSFSTKTPPVSFPRPRLMSFSSPMDRSAMFSPKRFSKAP